MSEERTVDAENPIKRGSERATRVEGGRYLVEHIPGARLEERVRGGVRWCAVGAWSAHLRRSCARQVNK